MKLLRIYSLKDSQLDESQCVKIQQTLKLDIVVNLIADNQLEGLQYPIFEFDVIDDEKETQRILSEISQDCIRNAVSEHINI